MSSSRPDPQKILGPGDFPPFPRPLTGPGCSMFFFLMYGIFDHHLLPIKIEFHAFYQLSYDSTFSFSFASKLNDFFDLPQINVVVGMLHSYTFIFFAVPIYDFVINAQKEKRFFPFFFNT